MESISKNDNTFDLLSKWVDAEDLGCENIQEAIKIDLQKACEIEVDDTTSESEESDVEKQEYDFIDFDIEFIKYNTSESEEDTKPKLYAIVAAWKV